MKHIFSAVIGRLSLGILVLGLILFVPMDVLAVSGADEGLETFAKILAHIVNFLTFISLMMLNWGGQLFGTEFITSQGVEESLRPLWVLIRNMVNLSFVLILVYLVFANMVNAFTGGGNWTIKEKLPKIIFAMIAINFSFLVMKVLIDAVNVGSVVILSIADTALESVVVNSATGETTNLNSLKSIMEAEVTDCQGVGQTCAVYEAINSTFCKEDNTNHPECIFRLNPESWEGKYNLDSASNQTARNLMLAFGTHFQNLEKLPLLPARISSATGTSGGFLAILDNVIFSSIMALAYIIVIGAVFIALVARVLVLWLAMIFSPAIMAMIIMGIGDSKKWVDMFVTHLIMPLKISAAFAFGFIMISALGAWEANIIAENPGVTSLIDTGPSLKQFFSNEYQFLWQILTIVLFWKAAFWALDGSIAETITNQIKEKTEAMGKFALKAGVLDKQIIPTVVGQNGEKLSLNDIGAFPRHFQQQFDANVRRDRQDKFANAFASMGMADPAMQEANEHLSNMEVALSRDGNYTDPLAAGQRTTRILEDLFSKVEFSEFISSNRKNDVIDLMGKKLQLDDNTIRQLQEARTVETFSQAMYQSRKEMTPRQIRNVIESAGSSSNSGGDLVIQSDLREGETNIRLTMGNGDSSVYDSTNLANLYNTISTNQGEFKQKSDINAIQSFLDKLASQDSNISGDTNFTQIKALLQTMEEKLEEGSS